MCVCMCFVCKLPMILLILKLGSKHCLLWQNVKPNPLELKGLVWLGQALTEDRVCELDSESS